MKLLKLINFDLDFGFRSLFSASMLSIVYLMSVLKVCLNNKFFLVSNALIYLTLNLS
jgi:hypothetical protein